MIKLINDDCLKALQELPENSIDTCITDPPYGLRFMGKEWDTFRQNRRTKSQIVNMGAGMKQLNHSELLQYQEWTTEWAESVYRVLKPGGLLLSFGGTRTYHRIACAIEDAGFEIRDCIMWVYGCLSEDTEILTINGWERYHKGISENPVLCYNIDNDTYEFAKPIREFCYENEHTAYHIQSDFTDQIVSRNHRCIVERGGRKVFAYAETLQREENIPFLESLRELPEVICNRESRSGVEKSVLLKLCEAQTKTSQGDRGKGLRAGFLRNLWKAVLQTRMLYKQNRRKLLLLSLQWSGAGQGVENSRSQRQAKLDGRVGAKTYRKNDGRKQPCLEGWCNLLQNTWELCWSKVCSLPKRIFGNGSQRWLCYGAQTNNGSIAWQTAFENRSCSSYQSRSYRQSTRKSDVIQEQSGTQTPRSTRAKVTPIEYHGKVWCVEVPTGAFIARRNGKIFITGNSGFPKSHDISKGIDKRFGKEREIIGRGKSKGMQGCSLRNYEQGARPYINGIPNQDGYNLTAPATPEAQLWDGWGTQLRPAYEPIVIAQKPLDGTYAENALKWGVAGYWIDGGRIENNQQGRFPSNVIHDGSDEVTALFPEDTQRFFYCAKASRSERNAGLEGMEEHLFGQSGGAQQALKNGESEYLQDSIELNRIKKMQNHHPTVKPLELMRYLVRLTKTPTGGVVLDPFMGSGTTGCACVLEGRDFIGIEKEPEYIEIAQKRIGYYQTPLDKFIDDK